MVDNSSSVPIVGVIAAGQPILASENIVGELLVDSRIVRNRSCFALRVTGDSMLNAGIDEGDYVVVHQQQTADSGDIVVALLGEEATLKRLHVAVDHIELRSENPRHRPIIVTAQDTLSIQGRVIDVSKRSTARFAGKDGLSNVQFLPHGTLRLVEKLERSVRENISGSRLVETLKHGLIVLRHQYRRYPSRFSGPDIDRLRMLRQVLDDVQRSMNILASIIYVQETAEYERQRQLLSEISERLRAFPVGKGLIREIASLPIRLPAIQAAEKERESRFISALEAKGQRCPDGHPMKIRRGRKGLFWGCSEYPRCFATSELK